MGKKTLWPSLTGNIHSAAETLSLHCLSHANLRGVSISHIGKKSYFPLS